LANATALTDIMDPARAQALAVSLGMPNIADTMPPFFHQIYFWDPVENAGLGRDGHPKVGQGIMPDMGLPRRMWGGGRLEFHTPVRLGQIAEKTSAVDKTTHKEGRSGPLGFVTLRHDIRQNNELCVTEYQDIVYLNDPAPDARPATPPMARSDGEILLERSFSSTDLFRYSALTFNGHRIHYDLDYCREVEGYDGLVVHGPLLAQTLMLLAERALGPLTSFEFRATAPALHGEHTAFCLGTDGAMWVRGPDGRQCMQAVARI
jgi:3-methylfumaryl-CoA hydratase